MVELEKTYPYTGLSDATDRQLIYILRDEIAEVYASISDENHGFLKTILDHAIWEITRHLKDENQGWEELDELKCEHKKLYDFFYRNEVTEDDELA
jgi:hypothetical protein